MITYGQVIPPPSLEHFIVGPILSVQSFSLLTVLRWNEPARWALWHLTALVLVSKKTGPSRNQMALGRPLGQKIRCRVSPVLLVGLGTV